MTDWTSAVLVALGGASGGAARHALSMMLKRCCALEARWGTLSVNLSGCLLAGGLAAFVPATDGLQPPALEHLLLVGFTGSYTTVSTFSLQVLALMQEGRLAQSFLLAALS